MVRAMLFAGVRGCLIELVCEMIRHFQTACLAILQGASCFGYTCSLRNWRLPVQQGGARIGNQDSW